MRGRKNDFEGQELFFLKITGLKPDETAHFEQKRLAGDDENGDMLLEQLEDLFDISGELFKVGVRDYDWKGDTIRSAEFWLRDYRASEVYKIQVGCNGVMRSIINALANAVNIGDVEISLTNDKKNGGWPSVFVRNNGEPLKWRWKMKDEEWASKIVENTITEKGKKVVKKDFFKLDSWLLDEILMKEINSKITIEETGRDGAEPMPPNKPVNANAAATVEETDDLPF